MTAASFQAFIAEFSTLAGALNGARHGRQTGPYLLSSAGKFA
jgi:hypothetical protein